MLDNARVSQSEAGAARPLANAEHIELHGRMAGGTPTANPVIELGLRLTRGTSQLLPVLGQPTDGVMAATVYGLKDLAPKPWRVQLREIAASQRADRDHAGAAYSGRHDRHRYRHAERNAGRTS